jgi:apolipoprotein N-acyltransferase
MKSWIAGHQLLLPLLSAGLLWLAFPPLSLWPLCFAALVPLLWAVRGATVRRAFAIGAFFGLAFFAALLHWIVYNPAVEGWVKPLLYLGVALAGAYLSLSVAVPLALAAWIARGGRVPWWAAFAALLPLSDYVRGQGLLGFPWGGLGYALVRWTSAIQMASVTGIYGLTCWVALVNGLIYWIALDVEKVKRDSEGLLQGRLVGKAIVLLIVFLIPPVYGRWMLAAVRREMAQAPAIKVALVQGNIEQGLRWDDEFKALNWETYDSLSRQVAVSEKPQLIIWPETALPFYLRFEEKYFPAICALADSLGCAIYTGTPDMAYDPVGRQQLYYNAAFLIAPAYGLVGTYAKSHLVPFGERFPLKDRIPWLRDVNFGEGEWTPGADTVLFDLGGLRISSLICFESIFPEIARRQAARGARLMVNITNDGWFGRSGAARQHADMAVLRAVETRRPVARCANSGVSMFILPDGTVLKATPLYKQVTLVHDLPLTIRRTFYNRFGDAFALSLLLIAMTGIVMKLFKKV